jgi:HAE1 family hydrophobic/amphiphilic exporter-1
MIKKMPGVNSVLSITGYSMLSGSSSSNAALLIAILDDWSKRESPELSQDSILGEIYMQLSGISSAQMIPFAIPSIPGLGTTGGFEFMLQDTKSDNPQTLAAAMGGLLLKANQTPELSMVFSTYRANVPQFYLDIDREKVKKLGLNLSDIFTTLQSSLGSMYINDFNKFGKVYQVKIQAEKDYRRFVQDISNLYVKNQKGSMVPLETLLSIRTVFGPQQMKRYNLFSAAGINGSAAPGYSSGQAMNAMEKISKETLPDGMTFEWTGMSYQEIIAGSMQLIIFSLSLLFAYLFLVAQYESWMLPLAVIFSVPVAFFGALISTWIAGLENNVYTQIGFVLLIGLAAKTAILIVEFAMEQHAEGKGIIEAALFAAKLRFRAVCMTAFAFVLGVVPLVIALGAGAASRRSLGTAVFGGMIAAGIIGTIVIPSFYVIIQKIREKTCAKKAVRST